jgi:hypothetical protein
MKLYRVTWNDAHEGTCYEWAKTAAAAEKIRKAVFDSYGVTVVDVFPIDVPTHKDKLVKWLKMYLIRANG